MRELPILFTADMVIASDEGRKTHTRRIIRPQPTLKPDALSHGMPDQKYCFVEKEAPGISHYMGMQDFVKKRSPYQPGDHLWIRQNFQIEMIDSTREGHYLTGIREDGSKFVNIQLTESEGLKFEKWKKRFQKKSKLFMFKSLAHKWIEVISVRAERLQNISNHNCYMEGIIKSSLNIRNDFIKLWDSINKSRGFPWESNPYVWDYEFKRIEK